MADDVGSSSSHGKSTTRDPPITGLARLFIQEDVAHGGLHVKNCESWVSEHHQLDVVVLVGEALHANVFEAAVGDGLPHLDELSAKKVLAVEEVVRIFTGLHGGVFQCLHLGSNHFVCHPVVVVAEFFEGRLSISTDPGVVLVLLH